MMKSCLSLILLCALPFLTQAQTIEQYASVRVSLVGKNIADLAQTGVETDHGQYFPGRAITLVLSTSELQRVKNAGFQTDILIPDLKKHYLEQRSKPLAAQERGGSCSPAKSLVPDYETPANYKYGTMGGYLTYDQMMAELDTMRILYPNLISVRKVTSDTILTWGGRPIYNVKISDNPDQDEAEREVLYTALHHAREPNSASQLIFFMWYLLENYADREDIQAIVNNLELYFIPCINVDGYLLNELTDPNGGGLWRKNLRDNGDGTYGVDLNRNYGYFWGDLGGSSSDPNTEIYRGPDAFSEPETRTVRDFCRAHDFLFTLNYHTAGNFLIYPWSYNDSQADPAFRQYAEHLTRENEYYYGTTSETVGYAVNGSSDDWMYAEKGTYSFTPEVGKTGFWPMPEEIDGLNKENLAQNFSIAYSALKYGVTKDLSGEKIIGLNGQLDLEFTRYGLLDGSITVTLSPFSSNIVSGVASQTFTVPNLEKVLFNFPYQLNPGVKDSDEVVFLLQTDNGLWIQTDTLVKLFASGPETAVVVFQDNLDNAASWTGGWSLTEETFHSAPTCMTDSPNAPYPPEVYPVCHLLNNVTIPANAVSANLRFWAKWDIEQDWDYVQVWGYGQNGLSKPLCGIKTNPGENTQVEGPIFDGLQAEWFEECMDLSDFIGQTLNIDFNFGADGGIEQDGFYFDDVRIDYNLPNEVSQTVELNTFSLGQNEPNPASGATLIRWQGDVQVLGEKASLVVCDALGKPVLEQHVDLRSEKGVTIETRGFTPGFYTYRLENGQAHTAWKKMSVVR